MVTYHVVAHGDEKIKEQGCPALLHFYLHSAALLEIVAAPDDQSEVLSSKLRVRVRSVLVGVACRGEDGGDLHALSESLFTQGKTFELVQSIAFGGAAG